jgi:hypothetical protein
MSWWKKGILFSILWIGLCIGAAVLHTDVFLAGRITPQQDEAISYRYGLATGLGLAPIWLFLLLRRFR